jgi:aminoglycoside phosphotransferase (APT) family kinase protein
MPGVAMDSPEALAAALASLEDAGFGSGRYSYQPVTGGTQAAVWRGVPARDSDPEIALRLTPKPLELIGRIAETVNAITAVDCPQTLSLGSVSIGGRTMTAQACTWIGSPGLPRSDMRQLGACLASLHLALRDSGQDFSDRRLTFERAQLPASGSGNDGQELPAWYVARHVWRQRIWAWLHVQGHDLTCQPVHGDLHWANIVPVAGGFGFIDFDKVMYAPPVFDLAKLIATGFFASGTRARFRQQRAGELLRGYCEVRPLSAQETAALEGVAVLLNEETARLGMAYDVEAYRAQASAVGDWWVARRRRRVGDPLGIGGLAARTLAGDGAAEQMVLWPELGEAREPEGGAVRCGPS